MASESTIGVSEKKEIIDNEGNNGSKDKQINGDKQMHVDKVDHNNNSKIVKYEGIHERNYNCLLAKRFGCPKNKSKLKQNSGVLTYVPFYFCMHEEFLMQRLPQIFPLSGLYEFLQSTQTRGPMTIRVNNLKSNPYLLNRDLTKRKIRFNANVQWSRDSFIVHSKNLRKGATPEFLHGHYILQDLSGFLPVMALAPQTTEKILDLCAGVGRKASHISDMMRNTGTVFANEFNDFRIRSLRINFCRLGVRNSIITNLDGRKFPLYITDFDRVLVDAPSSGSGIISKEPVFRIKLDEKEIERLANLQKELLLAAIDCVKIDGIIVYSTNSILPDENECIIDYVLKKRKVRLVETNLPIGSEGLTEYMGRYFNPQMSLARRFYPHTDFMDGSFVAKLKKFE